MSIFTGAGVAIITPFNEDGSINFEEFGKIIEDQIAGTPNSLYILGFIGIHLNLFPDLFDMHSHGCDISDRLHIPDLTEKFFLCEHMVRMLC